MQSGHVTSWLKLSATCLRFLVPSVMWTSCFFTEVPTIATSHLPWTQHIPPQLPCSPSLLPGTLPWPLQSFDLYLDMTSFGRLSMAHRPRRAPPLLVLPQVLGLNFSSTCALGGRMWLTAGLRAAGLKQTIGLWLLAPLLPNSVSTEQPLHLQSLFLSYKFRQFQALPGKVIMNLEWFCMHPLCASNSPEPTASAPKW